MRPPEQAVAAGTPGPVPKPVRITGLQHITAMPEAGQLQGQCEGSWEAAGQLQQS